MNVQFELTSEDLVAFTTFHNLRSQTSRRVLLGCGSIAFLLFFALPVLILVTTDEPLLETALAIWPLIVGPVLFALFLFPCYKWMLNRTARRMIEETDSTGYFGPCSLSIKPDRIVETKPNGESSRTWTAVKRILVTKDYVFIYTSSLEAFILPRRAFNAATQYEEFLRLLVDRASVTPEIS